MIVLTQACDICGEQKKQVNHWFKGYLLPEGAAIVAWDSKANMAVHEPNAHLCGIEHAMQWMGRQLERARSILS